MHRNERDHSIPAALIERPEFIAACQRHDISTVFALAERYGLSRSAISRQTEIKTDHVREIINGRRAVESFAVYERIADGLRIPGTMLGLSPRSWEPVAATSEVADTWNVTELVRRAELSDVGPSTIEALQAETYQLCRQYPYMPADMLCLQSRGRLRYVIDLLQGRTRLREHRDLLVVAGQLALLTGCLEYDQGLSFDAEATRSAAYQLGREADDAEIVAWSHEMSAWFAMTQGRYEDAVTFARRGQHADTSHGVAVQLAAQEAKGLARMGDRDGVRAALDRGRRLLDSMDKPLHPDHHFHVDPDKWDLYAMEAYRLLGDDALAADHARQVIHLGTGPDGIDRFPMRMSEARLTLGFVAARAGDLEHAIDLGISSMANARKSLPTLLPVADELSYMVTDQHPGEERVKQFREHLTRLHNSSRLAITQ
ncbi:tetratricopeptide repeat protein [Catenulispora rubra]|uniref:tetratricopeptide repeat protein n=1 Tax=Catenulispora rubra TaxID=280293 RepID=UPI0018925B3A|nr:tetratricopeptide repeat protein [Catenulispora rubra]